MAANGRRPRAVSIDRRAARFSESTIATRLRAVVSCYRYHQFNGGAGQGPDPAGAWPGGSYKPMLEHVARRRSQAVIRVRRPGRAVPPVLTPGQIERICDACSAWDAQAREGRGQLRERLLWALLEETGLRLGEALGLQHRDWDAGCGSIAFVEVVARDHPHGVRVKGAGRIDLAVLKRRHDGAQG